VNDSLLLQLADLVQNRFFGKYRGIVTDNADSDNRGRIQVKVPAVLGDAQVWAEPCVPYAGDGVGFLMLPEPETGVWIEFEGGDPSYPIWVGSFWASGQLPDLSGAGVKIIRTSSATLRVDDEAEEIALTSTQGGEAYLDAEVRLTVGEAGGVHKVTSSGVSSTKGSRGIEVGDASVSINEGAFEVT
jgi:uncharacterized protein involved in type VI secretion and phage assembly